MKLIGFLRNLLISTHNIYILYKNITFSDGYLTPTKVFYVICLGNVHVNHSSRVLNLHLSRSVYLPLAITKTGPNYIIHVFGLKNNFSCFIDL